jgi:hypothetical protein
LGFTCRYTSTLSLLGQVLTQENAEELVARAAFRTMAEVDLPAEVRRQVWERDGGRCAWVGPDGRRCDSRWQLEVDHVRPPSLGGTSTLKDLRLACKPHNLFHAEQVYGRGLMRKYRKGESAIPGDSRGAKQTVRKADATG